MATTATKRPGQRDHRHRDRDRRGGDDGEERDAAAGELPPGESVPGERGDHAVHRHGQQRHDHRVAECVQQVDLVERRAEVRPGRPMLEPRGLGKSYGPTKALTGVSLTIAEGEIVAVTGPSGVGKSTLLHRLAGIIRPESGEVTLDGRRIDTLTEAALTRLRPRSWSRRSPAWSTRPTGSPRPPENDGWRPCASRGRHRATCAGWAPWRAGCRPSPVRWPAACSTCSRTSADRCRRCRWSWCWRRAAQPVRDPGRYGASIVVSGHGKNPGWWPCRSR
ncbi:ATP-binding cassette domain-containing protein [Nonomuraea salmonea]|uniref:ATP-binding cassette domain-containing protein n=1 Tax=Nonomuraea salmonea TaxID=46181 RepID=UPI0031F0B52B